MPRKRYTPEEMIQHLRTVELETGKGVAVLDACRKLGITEQTYGRSFSTASYSPHSRKPRS
jgi:putative transposase